MHKFHIGQLVQFNPDRNERSAAPSGLYEVTKRLPHNGQEYEYRIKSAREEHERTAKESQLSTSGGSNLDAAKSAPAKPKPPSRPPAKGSGKRES
jgi:hypothetical protein